MRFHCAAANAAWIASSMPAAFAFHAGLHRVAEVQEALLLRTVRRNAQFASIRSIREYQQHVPIVTYEELGDPHAFTTERITHFETTSGSSGASKRIPYTESLRKQFGAAIAPWIAGLYASDPAAFAGEAYWSISPVLQQHDGFPDDTEYLGPIRGSLVRAVQVVPASVKHIQDVDEFRRVTFEYLRRCRSLSLISIWHPSFLTRIVGDCDTRALWPNLRVISCWADASSAKAAAHLASLFPHARIQPKGLLSTEGVVSIPLPDTDAPALAYRSHFFEFRSLDDNAIALAHQLEIGKRYAVILTTAGGLYRYDTNDVIEVIGFTSSCPLIRFVGRASSVSDHFGEKLHEIFVRERLDATLAAFGITPSFAMLAFDTDAYRLLIETSSDDALLARLTASLDDALRANPHYDYCRRLGQLEPLTYARITDGAARYIAASGGRMGGVKIPALECGGHACRTEKAAAWPPHST